MKKLVVSAFCLGLAFTSVTAVANTNSSIAVVASVANDDRQAVKPEELPEPIKKTLATDAYKGWTAKEAALVTGAATTADMSSASKDAASYYEVTLVKDKETKTVKFNKDGAAL